MTVVLHRRSVREGGKRLTVRIEEEVEVEESQGEVGSCRALSVSANSSALSNSMHVLMKHCWPAAHCQRHCYIDDWSIEGPCAFVRIQPSALPRPLPPLPSPLLILLPATTLSSRVICLVVNRRARCRRAQAGCIAVLERLQNNV